MTNKELTIKEIAGKMLYSRYPVSDEPESALMELGLYPSGAAMMMLSIMRKAVNNADSTSAKFIREALGEAEEQSSTRPLADMTDEELMARLKSLG